MNCKHFISEKLTKNPLGVIKLKELYALYEQYSVLESKAPPQSKRYLLKELEAHFDEAIANGQIVVIKKEGVVIRGLSLAKAKVLELV